MHPKVTSNCKDTDGFDLDLYDDGTDVITRITYRIGSLQCVEERLNMLNNTDHLTA